MARPKRVRWVDWYREFTDLARRAGIPPEEYEGPTGHGDEYVATLFRDGVTPKDAVEWVRDRQQRRARMGGSVVRARNQQHLPDTAEEDETMSVYTYTIFDANPNSSSGTEWPTYNDIEIECESDEEAIDVVRDVMSVQASGLNPSDGYDVGQWLYALVWDSDGTIVGSPTYKLTADDLGVDDEEEEDWAKRSGAAVEERRRAPMGGSVVRARNQQHLPGIEPGIGPIEIVIPTMGWEQINGDMDPGTYGGTIATGDGSALELIKIQPVRDSVGDEEAKDVGFPFWTKEAYFDLADLDPTSRDVKSALDSIGMGDDGLAELTPTQRALTIASALFDWGRGDEGPSGWSADINIPEKVKWSSGKVAGPEYLADEDDEFRREILLGDLDIDHESYGPDKDNPDSGLRVTTRGHTVEITEWTDIEAANGEEQPEGEKVVKRSAEVELDELFDPKGKHRGSYSGDDRSVSLVELAGMDDEDREKAIVAAAIAYLAYHGGDEEFVDEIGD